MKNFRLIVVVMICALAVCSAGAQTYDIIQERNGLMNVFARLKEAQPVKVLFITESSVPAVSGGSPSVSWSSRTGAWLKRQFPKAEVQLSDVACRSCGAAGTAALWPIVAGIRPDLVFIETAQQDSDTASDPANAAAGRNAERLIRQIRTENPSAEICFVYGLRKSMLPAYKSGRLPQSIYAHDVAAAHYRISSVNIGAALSEQVNTGKAKFEDFCAESGQLTEAGNAQAFDIITGYLASLSLRVGRGVLPYRLAPAADPLADAPFKAVPLTGILLANGWQVQLQSELVPGIKLPSIVGKPGGAGLKISFQGTGIVLLCACVRQPGAVELSVDGGPWQKHAAQMENSERCVWSLQVTDALPAGSHTVEVRVLEGSPLQLIGVATDGALAK